MLDDCAGLEQPQIALAIAGHLTKRLLAIIICRTLAASIEQARAVAETGFFERPADPQIADQAGGERRHPIERGDLDCGVGLYRH